MPVFQRATDLYEMCPDLVTPRCAFLQCGELCKITTKHVVNNKGWILSREEHKTGRKTGKVRVVHLTEELQALTSRLMEDREGGQHLFLNTRGDPWTVDSITSRFTRLREKLKLSGGECAYAYRHTGISNCIMEGVDVLTIAELFGTSASMILKHYGHLLRSDDELREAQSKATRPSKRRRTG